MFAVGTSSQPAPPAPTTRPELLDGNVGISIPAPGPIDLCLARRGAGQYRRSGQAGRVGSSLSLVAAAERVVAAGGQIPVATDGQRPLFARGQAAAARRWRHGGFGTLTSCRTGIVDGSRP
jgi:hypothetical protein